MLRPLASQVVVKELEKEVKTASGIILQQDKKQYEVMDAEVVAVGESVERKIKKGDIVIVDKAICKEYKFDNVLYQIVPEDCVICVVEGGKRGK